MNNKDSPLTFMTQGIPKVLGDLYQEPERKPKYAFLIILQDHGSGGRRGIFLFHLASFAP